MNQGSPNAVNTDGTLRGEMNLTRRPLSRGAYTSKPKPKPVNASRLPNENLRTPIANSQPGFTLQPTIISLFASAGLCLSSRWWSAPNHFRFGAAQFQPIFAQIHSKCTTGLSLPFNSAYEKALKNACKHTNKTWSRLTH